MTERFDPTKPYVPVYYRPFRGLLTTRPDWLDISWIFDLSPAATMALKYLLRAGRKPGADEIHDLTKAMEMIQRRINTLEQEGTKP